MYGHMDGMDVGRPVYVLLGGIVSSLVVSSRNVSSPETLCKD